MQEEILQHMWRYPSLSIHGIEGGFAGTGTKTVIPSKVIGKFSIRQVPNMQIPVVEKLVRQKYIFAYCIMHNCLRPTICTQLEVAYWQTI